MPHFAIRPFRRADRDQLASLVNGHAAAVMPGAVVSVNTVLNQLEREPGEFIVDPWVAERCTLVAEQAGAIVAAALLLRYRNDADVGEHFRGAGEIRWLLFWPMAPEDNPFWDDGHAAAEALLAECLAQLDRWQVTAQLADGSLPAPGVYGVPEQWPHIEQLYERAGFEPTGATELILMAEVDALVAREVAAPPGLAVRRLLGMNGTRLTAHQDGVPVAHIEVGSLEPAERHPRQGGLADVGNLYVHEDHRRRGVGSWLLRQAAWWLRLGRVERLLAYASVNEQPEEEVAIAFLRRNGFQDVTRTRKGWSRPVT
jgi:GNAT superfamily N-acetyltransferase